MKLPTSKMHGIIDGTSLIYLPVLSVILTIKEIFLEYYVYLNPACVLVLASSHPHYIPYFITNNLSPQKHTPFIL